MPSSHRGASLPIHGAETLRPGTLNEVLVLVLVCFFCLDPSRSLFFCHFIALYCGVGARQASINQPCRACDTISLRPHSLTSCLHTISR